LLILLEKFGSTRRCDSVNSSKILSRGWINGGI
jgi:hypothetical protein